MKVADRWRDLTDTTPSRNRFDIFTDGSLNDGAPVKDRSQSVAVPSGAYRVPNLPTASQTSKDVPRRSYDAVSRIRRSSLPSAMRTLEKPLGPKLDTRNTSPFRKGPVIDATQNYAKIPELSAKPESENISATPAPFSLWDYLKVELAATDSDEAHDFKRERVKNFLILPDALERTLMFGFIVCLDSFVYIFTILPLRFSRSLFNLAARSLRSQVSLKSSEKVDLLKGGLILMTCVAVNQLDASRIYHNIRGQAAIKLYVLYNVLEIGDKLFCALGQDILDCLFSKSTFGRKEDGTRRHLRPLAFLALAVIYNVLHTVLLFYQLVTLNVTVNSFSNALMTLLLSNQFVEIKGSVFKKFEKEGLFQITCADMVERFQLFIMLLIIGFRNMFEMAPASMNEVLVTVLGPVVTVLGSEVLVDWLKHAFITKFNHIRPTIYGRFTDVLCRDYVKSAGTKGNTYVDQSPAISRRIGLPVLPLVCLTVRQAGQIFFMYLEQLSNVATENGPSSDEAQSWRATGISISTYLIIGTLIFASLIIIKLSIGISLIRFAHSRYGVMQAREQLESAMEAERKKRDVYKGIVEVDADTKKMLNNVVDNLKGVDSQRGLAGLERYSMVSKRIY